MVIARGRHKAPTSHPMIRFTFIESFSRVLSQRTREILALIVGENPDSLS